MTKGRPYIRCQKCGVKFGASPSPHCKECSDGQSYFWVAPYAPASFAPIPQPPARK